MKVVDQGLTGFVTITLPTDEADLLYRATDGYVALARTLTEEVGCRFPEGKAEVERKLHGIHHALHDSIVRHTEAVKVWTGAAVAVDPRELERLREAAKRLRQIEKPAAAPVDDGDITR